MYSLVIVVSQLSGNVKAVYKATRFSVAKDTWPPQMTKEYTPLVLLHHEDEHTIKDVTTITKALHKGAISDVVSATSSEPIAKRPGLHSHDKLGEALKASKTTTDISEILAPLEVSDKAQTILIEGAPGIGKTILLKHIAYSWAEQGMLKMSELLLLVYLRDPIVQKMTSLKELFQYFCYKHNIEGEDVATCIKHISSNQGKTLTLLLDGYDEIPEELRGNGLIADILNRQVLPGCGLVVSSRPHASVLLREQATLRVDILGFTEEQRKHYIEHSLNNQSQIKQLTTYLDQHNIISSLCYSPFNILLLLFLYKKGFLPNNVTELYNNFICLTIHRNLSKYGNTAKQVITDINNLPEPYGKFIQQLSNLSLQALHKNQLIFTLDEIKRFCPQVESIPGALNAFGLLQAIEHVSIFETTKTFNFLHLSLQEFLAANYITTLTPHEELSILEKYFWRGSHSNMFTIYNSLTKGQRSSFRKFLSGGDDTIAIHSKFLDDKLKSIHLYRCFNEASGDDRVCRTIESNFTNGIIQFSFTTLSTNDIENISIFLTCSSIKQWKRLYLDACHIRDVGLRILHRILLQSAITIEGLGLYSNDLSSSSDGCLADIVIKCRVKWLEISYNTNIGQTEEFFPTILSQLETLDIDDINLSSRAAIMIFTALKEKKTKLKKLLMADNDVTDDACDVIAETLQVNSTLEELNIHGNKISKEALQLILNSLRHNNTLTDLRLPSNYSDSDEKQVLALKDIVNEERKRRGCQAKLNVKFSRWYKF